MNCIIVHGCPSREEKSDITYNKHWLQWTRDKLTASGIKTEIPLMPNPWRPEYESFKKEFEKYSVNKNTILIGHSCGCAFLVRWLGETGKKIDKLILVAPWKIAYRKDGSDKNFYEFPIDETIRSRVEKITIFTSDNDYEDGRKSAKIYHNGLGGKLIELKSHGHYTLGDMGTEEFPELIKEVLS
mgnify:CR=1 FL=1